MYQTLKAKLQIKQVGTKCYGVARLLHCYEVNLFVNGEPLNPTDTPLHEKHVLVTPEGTMYFVTHVPDEWREPLTEWVEGQEKENKFKPV